MHLRLKQETAVCFLCFFALARVSTGGYMQLTVPVLCGSPHVKLLFHLHMLAHLWVWVFPREKPWLAGCPVQTNTMFLNIHPISLFTLHFSFPPSSSVVDGTTTLIGLGTSTLIVHMTTPALSAVVCLIHAVLLFLGRSVFLCLAS